MCLAILRDFKISKNYGYKIFRDHQSGLTGDYNNIEDIRPVNKWLDEYDFREYKETGEYIKCGEIDFDNDINSYSTGWHIFLTKKAANQWLHDSTGLCYVLKKVKFKDVVAIGYQDINGYGDYTKVVVTKHMLICPEERG